MEVEAILESTRLSTFQNIMFDSRDFILIKVEIFSTFDLRFASTQLSTLKKSRDFTLVATFVDFKNFDFHL